jgi:cobalt/nickel transport system permease protein
MLPERNTLLPGWMLVEPKTEPPVSVGSVLLGRKVAGFTQKTIRSVLYLLQDTLFSERFARSEGVLQQIDPRTKLLTALMLLLTVSFTHSGVILGILFAVVFLLALISHVGVRFFFKRVWLVPLYTAIIALPATLNWITPGTPVWVVHRFEGDIHFGPWALPEMLAVTDNGLRAGLLFVLRVTVSVSIVVLLVLTTTWQKLLRALRILGVPHFFVFALGMTYRYAHLLLNLMLELQLGKKSRTLRASPWSQDQKWVASQMGYLFKRSQNLGENVYSAMLARGFQGEPKVLEELRWAGIDFMAIGVIAALCVAVIVVQSV